MGYTTTFMGEVELSRELTIKEAKELLEFAEDSDLIDGVKPSSYLQWVPSLTLRSLVWDGGEKCYNYEEWLAWVLKWLLDRGVSGSGRLYFSGESTDDHGEIVVVNSEVTISRAGKEKLNSQRPLNLAKLAELALEQATK